ncbi:hypothetical protein [Aridibaculum aurantiacum]|uniref:hypothetical protein n=1 Tax=Aridibaculum aurantiacum TaxID=2810307 RepID=UPI001A979950|nr:hypothetical protein [Aridibaculum aurantiacum]
MKTTKFKVVAVVFLLMTSTSFYACKGKQKDTTDNTTINSTPTTTNTTPAPVEISADDELSKGVKDATKDHPNVTANVNNGEITLTGDIERSKLPGLMQSLNSLRPKKINNNLNIK